ncbi:PetM family of cytochrome b6f complex subunit 7 [Methylobacterium gnaphalii]|uniref:PetM family of cytochrome b6f complex subunit 7 n=1 Tax=Methylobacterium gnaphalii TaxID=1010610 RepID=A0A512JGN5_9HYPH|nr:PetM family of cytochrome b6f complex subunit 7 [Methylobacterium gnaphalii]GEP09086.1 hypothetical protein MGN01_09310 [Methylobacterium gnaphalii]GJD68399.1 hypothetical protein MMMDOFMJ_1322 [Methylobacterium gnaphalii]GLS49010.1 hypothetical protein GCM10007885_18570 [Methylobacterium gnaphalii]
MLRSIASFLGLPFLSRALGLLLLAGGFVQIVYDGARSIANNTLRITTLSELLFALFKDKANALQGSIEGVAPWLWQALVLPLTLAPAAVVLLLIGAALLWLGQPGREPIGFVMRT